MSEEEKNRLGQILWDIANDLRGSMNADDFRDYMLSFLFLRYLSSNYEKAVQKELGSDYPKVEAESKAVPLQLWYDKNPDDIAMFEKKCAKKFTMSYRQSLHVTASPRWHAPMIVSCLSSCKKGLSISKRSLLRVVFQGCFQRLT